jgi:diguanylate cyclase (GGDEF)-like protein/PAS domain S-box-containing protein
VLAPAIPFNEETRLSTLRSLNILDKPPEERIDRLTRLAQRVFDVPIALVTLVDSDRQWFKSSLGLDATETPRSISFCGHAILSDDVFVVPDAALDPRFTDNPLVTSAPHIRFYAGQPLKAKNGSKLGTLCVLDIKPRQPSQTDLDFLIDLAGLVENELNLLDILETKDTDLSQAAERFRTVVDTLAEGVFLGDAEAKIIDCNPSAERIMGKTLAQMKGLVSIAPELQTQREDGSLMPKEELPIAVVMRTGLPQPNVVVGYCKPDESVLWVQHNAQPLFVGSTGAPSGFVISITDITERKKSEELIWQQANFDTLTGLPNRRMFHDRLTQEIKKSHRSGLPMALLLLDLDHFKAVNDALGHAQGDVLLVEVARRISGCVRETDTVARLGGDEFTVILSAMTDVNSVGRIAQNIIECLAEPFQLLHETVHVSASVGITLNTNDVQKADTLIKNADQAMYLAKNSGRSRFSYFTADLQEAAQTRLHMLSDLRNALAGNQLAVYYQPILEIATNKIYKAEALLRWQHPEHGMVSPMHFIPLAEESGLIHEIGNWVFHETTRELKRCRELFVPDFQISVNVSPVQFRQNRIDHISSWLSHLRAIDLPAQNLNIEITEGLLMHAKINAAEKLRAFRDAGIEVALDDFGTGYSSLFHLKKFDINYIKIDQSFIHSLADDANHRALCEAMIVMAHKLGLKVIAEGVETKQQHDLLAAYDCDYAQGWLYSKALPAEQFESLLFTPNRFF